MSRPEYLPEFNSPPLDEVVLGVQFSPLANYTSVYAKDVWALFENEFPKVEEQPYLDPSFETFGGYPRSSKQIQFGPPPLHGRLWFVSDTQNNLIQFQEDRLLLNWRRLHTGNEYPRFESIAESFERYIGTLRGFAEGSLEKQLDINQAEVAYINIIPMGDYSNIEKWLSVIDLKNFDLETVNLSFSEVINGPEGKPFARLLCEIQAVITVDGKTRGLRLSLTFRGKPAGNGISEAISFIRTGREKIVTRFTEMTTDEAHHIWERTK